MMILIIYEIDANLVYNIDTKGNYYLLSIIGSSRYN